MPRDGAMIFSDLIRQTIIGPGNAI